MGRRLVAELIERGAVPVEGNALGEASYRDQVAPADTFVHLVGVAHPRPAKAAQFRSIDLASIQAAVRAAQFAAVANFVYLSVAQPAPIMQPYIEVRREAESLVRAAGFNAAFVRPWYVLGPGHWWPLALVPVYKLMEWIPSTRESALRLGLVTIAQMTRTLVAAVENPSRGVRVVTAPEIRAMRVSAPQR